MTREFERRGALVVGPLPSVPEALALLATPESIDAAVLDINLRGTMAFSVADSLAHRRIPFIFVTGYDEDFAPERFERITCCEEPFSSKALVKALLEAVLRVDYAMADGGRGGTSGQ